ncbi:MAG: class I SAM-dependent methyltransferase [Bryobacteraceae bacterium]|nr:class I SAM-dependent methyltransferase [Bryobacteraceae bacterium]MDW8377916.1 class I SAM-dependent methyltransferase [Bryobacterales bacterium]
MADASLLERMRSDWNERAREDAHYYVAFGRHNQDDEEFFATAREVVYGLEYELRRLPPLAPRSRRALEIGCGPGRLLRPLSRHFGEIHGVDVSDEMVERARANLRGIPHAHVHRGSGADLSQFADESFDFVYSYAVFQHIPERAIVDSYLKEARRVLKVGGLLWFQVNGLPGDPPFVDTWSGVRFRPEELVAWANGNDFQMYTLEGVGSQYMWVSLRKRPPGWFRNLSANPPAGMARIGRISNPHGTEPVVPARGRFACASLWIDGLHPECGLNHLRVRMGEGWGEPNYIAAPLPDGRQQMNVLLPEGIPTGLIPVEVEWLGRRMAPPATMRVIPPGPMVPRLLSVADATDLLSGTVIRHGSVKVTFEELPDAAGVRFEVDGKPLGKVIAHCADPRRPRWEFVFSVREFPPGRHDLTIWPGKRPLPAVPFEIAG